MSLGIGRERQFEVFVGGARGVYPTGPVSFERLERAARKAMPPEGFAYVAGGAGTEETMRENRAAFRAASLSCSTAGSDNVTPA